MATQSIFARTIASYQRVLIFIGLFSLAINLLLLTLPLYMLQVYDRVLISRSGDTLLMLTILAVGLLGAFGVLDALRQRIMIRLAGQFDHNTTGSVFDTLMQRRVLGRGGMEGVLLGDVQSIRNFLSSPSFLAFFDAPWTLIFVALIFLLHPWLGIVAVIGVFTLLALALAGELSTRAKLQKGAEHLQSANQFAEHALSQSETIHAMGMGTATRDRWRSMRADGLQHQVTAQDMGGVLSGATKMARLLMQLAILGVGAWLAINEIITPGVMIAASIILGRALAPVESAIVGWKQFVSARGSYGRLRKVFQEADDQYPAMQLPPPAGQLSVTDVSAAPPGSKRVFLRHINFSLNAGEMLGIIGPSAAGKSMLVRLLVGIWKPQAGAVRLDGVDIADWGRDDLGPHIGYLSQEISLLGETIADVIARCGDVDHEKVVDAAKIAGVHDMVLSLPDGYDTRLGTDSGHLSAGQRQRIGLARAVYGHPKLIVLDEPNSNLDGEGEAALREAIRRMKEVGSTVIVVSHRAAALALADKVLVLHTGQQEMFGPRDEVLSKVIRRVDTETDKSQAVKTLGPSAEQQSDEA